MPPSNGLQRRDLWGAFEDAKRWDFRLPRARPRTPRALIRGNGAGMHGGGRTAKLRARRTWAGRIGEGVSSARSVGPVEGQGWLNRGGRIEPREAGARPFARGPLGSPRTISITPDVGLQQDRPNVDTSSKTPDVGLHRERPNFNCFHKVIIEAGESEEGIEATNATNNTKQLSSRGGEASGAAASGRGRDSAARQLESGFGGGGRARPR
jgi:hypothetical protein